MKHSAKIGLGLFLAGGATFLFAYAWAAQSANDPEIIGANIGAGLVGITGIAISLAGLLVLIIGTLTRSKKH